MAKIRKKCRNLKISPTRERAERTTQLIPRGGGLLMRDGGGRRGRPKTTFRRLTAQKEKPFRREKGKRCSLSHSWEKEKMERREAIFFTRQDEGKVCVYGPRAEYRKGGGGGKLILLQEGGKIDFKNVLGGERGTAHFHLT